LVVDLAEGKVVRWVVKMVEKMADLWAKEKGALNLLVEPMVLKSDKMWVWMKQEFSSVFDSAFL
jgi:hypothetical protein